jgi:ribosomal protein S18 acetylase RimI-like enzyme
MVVRRATLADVAAVARLTVAANREGQRDLPALQDEAELSSPELALRLLDDLDDGSSLYVVERESRIVGFALVTGLMVGDGGHLVELRRLYVMPDLRRQGAGRRLLTLVRQDLAGRPNPPSLRAWAPSGSRAAAFLERAEGAATRQRWKVGPGGIAIRGVVYAWMVRPAVVVRGRVLAK